MSTRLSALLWHFPVYMQQNTRQNELTTPLKLLDFRAVRLNIIKSSKAEPLSVLKVPTVLRNCSIVCRLPDMTCRHTVHAAATQSASPSPRRY